MRELSLHILDATENSLQAGATRIDLAIEEDLAADRLTITVSDNGRGMSGEQLSRVFDPFFTTRSTRHVGLGIPLFQAAAQRCNGDLTMTSELGRGTRLKATFQHSHIDRAPLGNIVRTLMAIILSADRGTGPCDLQYVHTVDGRVFEFDTAAVRAELGDISLAHPAVRSWLQDYLTEGEAELRREA
jgi:hypothetical protein